MAVWASGLGPDVPAPRPEAHATRAPEAGLTRAAAPRAAAPVLAGDMIVKFRDTSEAGASMNAVLSGSRTIASAAPVAARLSTELGVPLRLVHVTSGREALLAIDRDALLASLAQRAAREPGVASAVPVVPGPGLPPDLASVRLRMTPGAATAPLAEKLVSGSLVRPRVHSDAAGTTLLSVDLASLTLALLDLLTQRADVEYAQANRLLRPVAPTGPTTPR